MVRLFVGGVPPDVEPPELRSRFSPFGEVRLCEYAKPKPEGYPGFPPVRRGFAYIELEPKDEAAISKCLSVYNHSRWRGHVLRVEIARPDFHERIMIEKQEDEAADEYEEAEAPDEEEEPLIPSTKALYFPIPGRKNKFVKAPLDGSLPDGTKRMKKSFFPPVASIPLEKIEWSVLKTPKSAIKKLNALELLPSKPYNLQTIHEPAATTEERIGIAVPMKYAPPVEKAIQVLRPKETHGYLKILKSIDAQSQRQSYQEQNPAQLQINDHNGNRNVRNQKVVDFLDKADLYEESGAAGSAGGDMHRFDDSSSDDDERSGGGGHDGNSTLYSEDEEVGIPLDQEGDAEELQMADDGQPGDQVWSELEDDHESNSEDHMDDNKETLGGNGEDDKDNEEGTSEHVDEENEIESLTTKELPKPEPRPVRGEGPSGSRAMASAQPSCSQADFKVPSKASKRGDLDLSRFGSDSEEDYKDVDSGDEKGAAKRGISVSRQARESVSLRSIVKPRPKDEVQHKGRELEVQAVKPPSQSPASQGLSSPQGVTLVAAPSIEPSATDRNKKRKASNEDRPVVHQIEAVVKGLGEVKRQPREARQAPSHLRYCPPAVPLKPVPFSFSFVGESSKKSSLPSLAPTGSNGPHIWLQGFGQGFVRSKDKSDLELRNAWNAQREALVSDFKGKQRTALRHAGKGLGKKPMAKR